jgi:hypothetical protein
MKILTVPGIFYPGSGMACIQKIGYRPKFEVVLELSKFGTVPANPNRLGSTPQQTAYLLVPSADLPAPATCAEPFSQ